MYREYRLGSADEEALEFTSSLEQDDWIFDADLKVDRAHLAMLLERGLVSGETAREIRDALKSVEAEGFDELEGEDVHEAIEAKVISIIGEEGGRLHTARSRNDEVATCIRMAARRDSLALLEELLETRRRLLDVADENLETVIPAYTHLQRGQSTTLAHHLSSHERRLSRDTDRLLATLDRTNRCPLGSCAAVSTTLPIDRDRTSELLGFDGPLENTMDAVSTRDFATELIFVCSSLMQGTSRLAEEVVLWSSSEFGLLELDDSFSTTSSIMPQKKNPDLAELVRAKTSTVIGHLTSALSLTKALPQSYNRDLQELTPHLGSSLRSTIESLGVLGRAIETGEFMGPEMDLEMGATDLAEALVKKGLPFRKAHSIVGELSRKGLDMESAQRALSDYLPADEVIEALDTRNAIASRDKGGPGSTEDLLETGRRELERHGDYKHEVEEKIDSAYEELEEVLTGL